MKNWYVIYTKPRNEKKVAELLNKKGIETYCPIRVVEKQWSDRKKKVPEPLFTSYCFVKIEEHLRNQVFEVPGVIQFVFWLKKPAIVRDEEIDEIKRWLNDFDHSDILVASYSVGDRITIDSGSFKDSHALVIAKNTNQVVLLLENMGLRLILNPSNTLLSKK